MGNRVRKSDLINQPKQGVKTQNKRENMKIPTYIYRLFTALLPPTPVLIAVLRRRTANNKNYTQLYYWLQISCSVKTNESLEDYCEYFWPSTQWAYLLASSRLVTQKRNN